MRQAVDDASVLVPVVDVVAMRELLDGRPAAARCRACDSVLPVEFTALVVGDGWTAEVMLDGDGHQPMMPGELIAAFDVHLEGLLAALWQSPDRAMQHEIARARQSEFTAEAVAVALLAAHGQVPGWVVGDGGDPQTIIDDMLGPPQASALVSAALTVLAEPERELASTVEAHVRPGLVMPRAAKDLGDAVAAMCSAGRLSPPERLAVLTMHAAARDAAGQDDPLSAAFTRQWISYAWAANEHPDDRELQRLRPPPELLVRAVDPHELTTAVFETTDAPVGWMERLQQIAEEAGLPRLIRQAARGAPVMAEASSEVLRSALSEVSKFDDPRRLAEGLRFVLGVLNASQRTDELEAMTDHALALSDDTPEARAMLLTQLGSAAKDARRPVAFLDKVGQLPAGWEAQLRNEWRLSMDTERSSALRMAGLAMQAQSVLRPYLGLTFDRDTRWRLEFNLALIDRDAGATDLGLQALATAADDDERFLAHQALARTVTALGRQQDSARHLRAAIACAHGEHAHHAPTLRASLASVLAAAGDTTGARAELDTLDATTLSPQAAVAMDDAIAVLFEHELLVEQSDELEQRVVSDAMAALAQAEARAGRDGDITVQGSALRVRARLHELAGEDDAAAAVWETLLKTHHDELALVSLATIRGGRGRIDEARALLVQVPEALLAAHREIRDLGALLDSTGRLRASVQRLGSTMMAGRPLPRDVRFAAELARDAIGRVRAWSAAAVDLPSRRALAAGLPEEALQVLAPDTGTLWVIEWWAAAQGVVTLLTGIDATGSVSMRALPAMPVDAPELARQVQARLRGWWPGRPGDPLAHPGWQALGAWLQGELRQASAGDHLVVIEHGLLAGLPWHALDVAWTTSYAPSWSALLDLPAARPLSALGVLAVPAREEAPATVVAFDGAVATARNEAARRNTTLAAITGVDADSTAALGLLGRSDLVMLLCHGLVDPDQLDLALLVAADHQLPSQHPIAASSAAGREHRLTWRTLQDVPVGPSVVLSAACSTGRGLIGGMGERLGLFGALRPRATRAVVAPAWDAIAVDAVSQLQRVQSLLLNGRPLAAAIKETGDEAAQRLPAWRARCLCVEGDWR
jgi:tetratricopeptide (TPR) repeat protein